MTAVLPRPEAGYRNILVRVFVAALGGAAIFWGAATIQIFWQQTPIEYIARHVIQGEPYRADIINRSLPAMEAAENAAMCRPIALWSAAIIRLRMVEQAAHDGSGALVNASSMKNLDGTLRRALSCIPSDPFLWMTLDWVESARSGVKQRRSDYLRMSYQLGPNEGWIALKRNPMAFAAYEKLPFDLRDKVIDEMVGLINSEFYQQAATILSGPAWRFRGAILPRLAALPQRRREVFAKTMQDRGSDVIIPEVAPLKSRR